MRARWTCFIEARGRKLPVFCEYQPCSFALGTPYPAIIPYRADPFAAEFPVAFYSKLENCRGVPVILDAEKDRPHLKDLLPLADYIICNRHFPEAFTGRC